MEGEAEEAMRGDGDGRGLGGAAGGRRQRDASLAGRQVIRWERFLPRRSLKVLLVEYDDSTRHIVTALLRKCSYHVAAVADGMKAWEVLKERHYSFDLVLTEVAMPSLSGIGLLTKIVASEECKNIPVIMMSSHDSVGVVYKCMLKGAVDFLVKPVRKNELRNLWQHVWRKHCSSSYANASDNNAASNHISADAGDRSKAGENSGERSTTQSSGSKPDAEIESVWKPMEPNLAEQGSFSGQVEEKLQHPVNGMTMAANALKMDKSGRRKGKSVEIGVEVILPIREASIAEKGQKQNKSHRTSPYRNGVADPLVLRSKEDGIVGPGLHRRDNGPNEPLQSMVSFVKSVDNGQCGNAVLEENASNNEALCAVTMMPDANNANNFSSVPLLEPSLRRPQQNGCVIQEFKERHILIHSNASAFSRYGEKRIHPSSQKSVSSLLCIGTRECDDKCHSNAHSHGIDDEKNTCLPSREMFSSPKRNEEEAMVYLQVSSGVNKEEAGILCSGRWQEDDTGNHSSTGEVTGFHQAPLGFISLPIPVGEVPYQSFCVGYSAILHPMFHPGTSLAQHCSDTADVPKNQIPCDQSVQQDNHLVGNNPYFKFQPHEDSHQSYHTRQPNGIEASERNAFSCSPVEPANQSGSCSQDILNGIGSNGSGETPDATGNTGTALESGNESGVQNCNSKTMDSDRARREAALIKFRLKRKDRCFEKRVRYHSRKKLAEQRPRIKGQFVRHKVPDSVTATEAGD